MGLFDAFRKSPKERRGEEAHRRAMKGPSSSSSRSTRRWSLSPTSRRAWALKHTPPMPIFRTVQLSSGTPGHCRTRYFKIEVRMLSMRKSIKRTVFIRVAAALLSTGRCSSPPGRRAGRPQ